MRDILLQVLNVPGTVGALAYDAGGNILASVFPDRYGNDALQRLTRRLAEDFMVQQSMSGAKGGLDLRFGSGHLLIRPCGGGAILALCTATANAQLVALALQQAEHRFGMAKQAPVPEPPAPPPPPPSPPPQAPSPKPVAPQADPTPSASFDPLKRAFVGKLGPIGNLLFSQIYAQWARSGGKPQDFVQALAREIDEPADQKSFLHEGRTLIPGDPS